MKRALIETFLACRDALLHRLAELRAREAATRAEGLDWREDFDHENGKYSNACNECGQLFLGHKRRVTCRRCSIPARAPDVSEEDIAVIQEWLCETDWDAVSPDEGILANAVRSLLSAYQGNHD